MAVVRRKDGRWTVRGRKGYWPDEPNRSSEYFGRGENGRIAAINRDDELGNRQYRKGRIKTTTPLFHQLAAAYDVAGKTTMQPSTHKNLEYRLKVLIDGFGVIPAEDLTPARVDKWVSQRLQTVKRVTVNSDITYLKRIMAWAVEQHIIGNNPIEKYRKPKRDDAIIIPPSMAETRAILINAEEHIRRALILCHFTGIRPGPVELFRLRYDDVDIGRGIITITSARKGAAKSRPLPLHPQLAELLQEWRREDGHKADLIIHYKGRSVKSIKTGFAYAKLASCITRRIRPYDFRHAPITTMLLGGKDIKTVSALAGHSNPTTTARVYSHTNMDAARDAINSIPRLDIDTTSCVATVQKQKKGS